MEFAVTSDYQIRRVRVTGYERPITEFTFEEEKVNPPMDSKVFRFQLPAGAKLMEDNQ